MKKKIVFVVPDGTGFKNYLLTNILPYLYSNASIILYHNLSKGAIKEVKKRHQIEIKEYNLKAYKESYIEKFYRESISYARLLLNTRLTKNKTILTNWNEQHIGLKRIFYIIIKLYGKFLSLDYKKILKVEKKYQKILSNKCKREISILQEINPDKVFCTHQRSLNALPIIKAAQLLDIETNGVIYSWDNLPKARLTVRTDNYFVWSQYMKNELIKFYPEIKDEHIFVTGSPQFEFYFDKKNLWTKDELYSYLRISQNKEIILYTGGDLRTSPYDQFYVEAIATELLKINENKRPTLVVRPTPVDNADRYQAVIQKHKGLIILSKPLWKNEKNWTFTYPKFEDIQLLSSIIRYSITSINVGSTIAFDCASFNKPSIYINFNVIDDKNWNINDINNFEHFKSKTGLNPVIFWNKKEDFIHILNKIKKQEYKLDNLQWFYRINNYPKTASYRISNLLLNKK